MPLHELSSTSIILLGSNLGCLLLLFVLVIGLSRKVARLSAQITMLLPPPVTPPTQAPTSGGQQGSFEAFLSQDPSRSTLSKNEQFAAYREWRRENGLNWSPSESPNTP